ncbi:hypothetical protein CMI47_01525 [Candidatus Pacearchaeota archaeon]|jgi:hypothetical protein|nr:hypothetical protein [Candidatus Pacearchaeota archaeon]|tara:strand:- start:196 stop:384 length:189 start_codon:yes stop_codon:yes gene_type:complete
MDTRDLWENQVDLLTNQCRMMVEEITHFDERVTYLENVLVTLLVALKEGGVIVDSDEGEYEV